MFEVVLVSILTVLLFAGLAYYLLSHDNGPNEPIWALVTVFVIGLGAAVLAGVINQVLIPYAIDSSLGFTGAVVVGLIPGIYEEILKSLPVAFFVNDQSFFRQGTDGVIYFAFSGLAFGLLENIQYTIQSGATVGFDRLLTLLFFHAATSGIFGYYFFQARTQQNWGLAIKSAGLLILAHAVYNFTTAYAADLPVLRPLAYAISIALSLILIRTYATARRTDRQATQTRAQ